MKIYKDINKIPKLPKVVLTQGTFDGLHPGHQTILKKVISTAQKINGTSVLLTFYPHPKHIIYPTLNEPKLLTSLEEKIEILDEIGLDVLVVLQFTEKFSQLSPTDYINEILYKTFKIDEIIIGYDHKFGKNREGGIKMLKEYQNKFNFRVNEISAVETNNCIVSSTKIRTALLDGNVHEASKLLERNYSLNGKVVSGDGLGKKLGFPTANIEPIIPYKLIPKVGVYAVFVEIDQKQFLGMINIGYRPSINNQEFRIEVHIFDFLQDIYNKTIKIKFIKRMRNEQKFNSLEELKAQLNLDKRNALNILRSHNE